ncbi:MAG: CoA pyrophosphatase [Chloroflexi bacterium]|nr:CoA pyrophosphatase [Chloroflexota bacterium]
MVLPQDKMVCCPTRETIIDILAHRQRKSIDNPRLRAAAVLVPLFEKSGALHVLLTRRTDDVEYHKGQICFPGGGCDAGDRTRCETALREAFEEIGLRAQDAEILGELDDSVTVTSGFLVSAFVAFIPYPYPFILNQRETKESLEVPLSVFLSLDNFKLRQVPGMNATAYFVDWRSNVIWGATAAILKNFADLLVDWTTKYAAALQRGRRSV